jgi:hypothetical protein
LLLSGWLLRTWVVPVLVTLQGAMLFVHQVACGSNCSKRTDAAKQQQQCPRRMPAARSSIIASMHHSYRQQLAYQ